MFVNQKHALKAVQEVETGAMQTHINWQSTAEVLHTKRYISGCIGGWKRPCCVPLASLPSCRGGTCAHSLLPCWPCWACLRATMRSLALRRTPCTSAGWEGAGRTPVRWGLGLGVRMRESAYLRSYQSAAMRWQRSIARQTPGMQHASAAQHGTPASSAGGERSSLPATCGKQASRTLRSTVVTLHLSKH